MGGIIVCPFLLIHHKSSQKKSRRRPDRARRGVAQEAELQAVKDKMSKEAEKHKRWHAKSAKDTEGFLKKVKKAGSDWVSEASASR